MRFLLICLPVLLIACQRSADSAPTPPESKILTFGGWNVGTQTVRYEFRQNETHVFVRVESNSSGTCRARTYTVSPLTRLAAVQFVSSIDHVFFAASEAGGGTCRLNHDQLASIDALTRNVLTGGTSAHVTRGGFIDFLMDESASPLERAVNVGSYSVAFWSQDFSVKPVFDLRTQNIKGIAVPRVFFASQTEIPPAETAKENLRFWSMVTGPEDQQVFEAHGRADCVNRRLDQEASREAARAGQPYDTLQATHSRLPGIIAALVQGRFETFAKDNKVDACAN